MAQYKTGTASVVQDSPVVSGVGTSWLSNVNPGASFVLAGSGMVYDVASVDSNTQITLTAPYRGATRTGAYAIQRDFTTDGIPEMAQGDIETATIFTRAMRRIQGQLNTVTGVAGVSQSEIVDLSGWADYSDTANTEASPFVIAGGDIDSDVVLPNNGLAGPRAWAPPGFDFYDPNTQKILGTEGHGRMVTINCDVVPTSPSTTLIEFWFDIGGSVGQLYRRPATFPKGAGELRPITFTTGVYTLDTWQGNGATVYVRANGPCEIYNIRYVIHQLSPIVSGAGAGNSAGIFIDTAAGLAATQDGGFFWVSGAAGLTLYQNDAGAAVEQQRYPTSGTLQSAVDALTGLENRFLALLTSLHPDLIGTTTRLDFLAQSYLITEAD